MMLGSMVIGSRLGTSEGLDTQVQGTNDDAQISKLSCSRAGYFNDAYVQYFVRKPVKRSPLINRGYYSRYAGLRHLLLKFLNKCQSSNAQAQVLVLGAGFDTTFFQLAQTGSHPARFLELDFKQVTQRKVAIIKQQQALWSLVQSTHENSGSSPADDSTTHASSEPSSTLLQPANNPATLSMQPLTPATAERTTSPQVETGALAQLQGGHAVSTETPSSFKSPAPRLPSAQQTSTAQGSVQTHTTIEGDGKQQPQGEIALENLYVNPGQGELVSRHYTIIPVDLRDTAAMNAAMARAGLDPMQPTYILSECVMVYMEPEASNALLQWASSYFGNAMVAIYEQIKPEDAFGRQMMSNLESRGCPLRGLPATPSLQAHCKRLVDCGWQQACAWSMDSVYKWHLNPEDKARVEKLEVFDEFEEWHLIQEHYSISVGYVCSKPAAGTAGLLEGIGFGHEGMVTSAATV